MKKQILCYAFPAIFLLTALSQRSIAQTIQRNLLPSFTSPEMVNALIPRENFKPFPQSPEGWRRLLPDSVISSIIHRGEKALDKEFEEIPATVMLEYVRNNNRSDYEKIAFDKRNAVWDMVLAEAMEGKGRFVDHILDGIWSICEESFWGASAHLGIQKAGPGLADVENPIVDLFSAETGAELAWTDYFIGPQLDKVSRLIRKRISYEISRRIFTPMLTAKYGWMGGGDPNAKVNNWAPWIASNYVTAALLIEKDASKRIDALNIAIRIFNQYINGLGDDGGCDEGPGYWTAAGGCVLDGLNILYDATSGRYDIYKDPFIKKIGEYIYNTHIDSSYFINVADAHPTMDPDGLLIFRFGSDVDDLKLMNMGSWAFHTFNESATGPGSFHRTRSLYDLLTLNKCAAYPYKQMPPADVWYSDVQLMASRVDNKLFVATHAGNNGESHNHNDVGDFTIYAYGKPAIIDVGSGTYTARTFSKDRYKLWFNTSAYHNLPTINGEEQSAGTAYDAKNVKYEKRSNATSLSMDIASAYPKAAEVKSWKRTVTLDKSKEIVTVTDNFTLEQANTLAQTFMTVCSTDISVPGKIIFLLPGDRKLYLEYDKSFWTVGKERMLLTTPEDQGLKHSWDGQDIWRILLTAKSRPMNHSVRYTIHL